jgi:DDE superfamily endonuclease
MNNKEQLDIYSDYLISAFGQTTGTGLAGLLGGRISHDQIQRMLSKERFGSAELWQVVKPYVRQIQREDGVMIIDDSLAEKPYTDENDIICWHYDHSQDRSVKGINFVTCWYHADGYSLPVGFSSVAKTEYYLDKKNGKQKRRSPISKNDYYRELLTAAKRNQIPFRYVLSDVWYSAADNMMFIKHDLDKDFIMPLKVNRKVALSEQAKRDGQWVRLDQLTLEANTPVEIYLESVDFPLLLVKHVFANEDGSTGIQYLVSSDTTLTFDQMTAIYRKRWNVEPYHKSLKQNASLEKSPTQTVTTQSNHLFASLCAYIKLEWLRKATNLNHFALKTKLYVAALHSAFATLRQFQPIQLAA